MRNLWKICSVVVIGLSGCTGQAEVAPEDVKAMMDEQVQPSAENYWNAVQYISDEKGLREIYPRNGAEWGETAKAARQLKEMGERLKRPEFSAHRGSDWQDFAQGMVETAAIAERAAHARSKEQVLEAGGTLYKVCSACHEVYMPSPGGLAPKGESGTSEAK